MAALTSPHERALTLLFAEIESAVSGQEQAFLGTPGTLQERTNDNGTRYWVHRYSDGLSRRHEVYLGKSDDPEAAAQVAVLRKRIDATNATINQIRLLTRAGFASVDRKAYYTIASLHNNGLFRAGALLIGPHAYGALLNTIGVRAVPSATEDTETARSEALAISGVAGFLKMLRDTDVEFIEAPAANRGAPSVSSTKRGGARPKVDLLVPSADEGYSTIPVPELEANVKGVPYLAHLLGKSQQIPVLSSHGAVLVRVPAPERYAIHKLIVSQLPGRAGGRPEKDLRQAAILIETLVEHIPGVVEDALRAVPESARQHLSRAMGALEEHLPRSAETAWAALKATSPPIASD